MKRTFNCEIVRKAMADKHWTIGDLATEIKVSETAVYGWLNANRCPQPTHVRNISLVLDIPYEQLVSGEDIERSYEVDEWFHKNSRKKHKTRLCKVVVTEFPATPSDCPFYHSSKHKCIFTDCNCNRSSCRRIVALGEI